MLVAGILAFMAATMIPATLKMIQLNDAKSIAKEITGIQEAERSYYINQMNANNGTGSWSDTIQQLQQGGYISANWNGLNIFGNGYTLTDNGSTLTVSTSLPSDLVGVIQSNCIDVTTSDTGLSNASVSSTIPVPAAEPALSGLVHRYGTGDSRTATQTIGTQGSLMVGLPPTYTVTNNKIQPPTYTNPDGTDSETIPDIYDSALQKMGISPTGWLSDASFPANLITRQVRAYGIQTIYIPTDVSVASLTAFVNVQDIGVYIGSWWTSYTQVASNMLGMNEFVQTHGTAGLMDGAAQTDTVYFTGTCEGQSFSFALLMDNWWANPPPETWTFSNCEVVSADTLWSQLGGSYTPNTPDVYHGTSTISGNQVIVGWPSTGVQPWDTTITFNIQ